MLHFSGGERLGEGVGDHVIGGAINEAERALFDHPSDPMIAHVDMLCARVVLMIARERDGRLVVGEKSGGVPEASEDFGKEGAQPQRLLHAVRRRDVLALCGGQGDDLLPLG